MKKQAEKTRRGPEKFDFENLFILEIANNHGGSIEHGLRIIREHAAVAKKHGVRAAFKFQFRNHDTYVHPDYRSKAKQTKLIKRFLETELSKQQFKILINEVRKQGGITMSTPWDEDSVGLIEELDIDVLKIASCSAEDWPLLERAVKAGKPIIASTGSLDLKNIDKLASFFSHKYAHVALMHCVAIYPTPVEKLYLNQVQVMKERYPNVTIGFSTHEDPDNTEAIQIAYAMGARIFERHINVVAKDIPINKYSAVPEQMDKWFASYARAVAACGPDLRTTDLQKEEKSYLNEIVRGTFLKRPVKKGAKLSLKDVFFAIPISPGQLESGQFRDGILADKNYKKNAPLAQEVRDQKNSEKDIIYHSLHTVKGMLNQARIPIHHEYEVLLYHHYGLENFHETGAVLIDCVNREYCKKLVVQLPGQNFPLHHHLKKEETFHVLAGKLEIEIEGRHKTLYPGDTQLIQRGVKHAFWTDEGAIFEELSTTYFNQDSLFADREINSLPKEKRTTKLINWGVHQFD